MCSTAQGTLSPLPSQEVLRNFWWPKPSLATKARLGDARQYRAVRLWRMKHVQESLLSIALVPYQQDLDCDRQFCLFPADVSSKKGGRVGSSVV